MTVRTLDARDSPPAVPLGRRDPAERRIRGVRRHPARQVVVYAVLGVCAIGFLTPWAWMLSTSLKSPDELAAWPPVWIPERLRWDNFAEVFRQVPFLRYIGNTVIITVSSVIGCVLSNTVVAYGFACLRWPGRDILFGVLIATLMLPAFVTFIPLYTIFAQLGWINTYLPLIVPTFLGNAFFVFLLRQFFRRIPPELADALGSTALRRCESSSRWPSRWSAPRWSWSRCCSSSPAGTTSSAH